MEPTLVIVGLSHRTAGIQVRERFWMNQERRRIAIAELARAEGVDEALVFSTCQRTEFVLWGDATLAANSVLRFLTAKYSLKLCDWKHFYRLLDEQALAHAFRVSCGLDALELGERQIGRQVNQAWQEARNMGASGRFLDAILKKALAVRRRVRKETGIASYSVGAPRAAIETATQALGSLSNANIVVVGAGKMGESAAQSLTNAGAQRVWIASRTDERAQQVASRVGVSFVPFETRWDRINQSDVVICATSAPSFIVDAETMKLSTANRARDLLVIDLGMPRNVDPMVRDLPGIALHDLDDLEEAVEMSRDLSAVERRAEKIVDSEAEEFRKELSAESSAPGAVALSRRLEEICRQELESFRLEQGPFPKDQDQLLAAVSARITHKIAGSLARSLKGLAHT